MVGALLNVVLLERRKRVTQSRRSSGDINISRMSRTCTLWLERELGTETKGLKRVQVGSPSALHTG